MFTGIVEAIGTTTRIQKTGAGYQMTFRAPSLVDGCRLGDSIAVNGTCLTVTGLTSDTFSVCVAPETLSRTNLGSVKVENGVNLERSLTPTSRMGGHFVQGHVDATGAIVSLRPDRDSLWVTVGIDQALLRLIVPKGYIALDGVSLTVVDVFADSFSIMLIDYTQKHATLADQRIGYRVNVEVDILGKYVEKMISSRFDAQGIISQKFLTEHGYNKK